MYPKFDAADILDHCLGTVHVTSARLLGFLVLDLSSVEDMRGQE